MGFLDKLQVDKIKKQLGEHSDKVAEGLEKAAGAADSVTKGKYRDQIKTGTEKAKEAVEGLSEQDDKKNKKGKNGKDKS